MADIVLDENTATELRRSRETRGHHVWSCPTDFPKGTSDHEIVAMAVRSDRILVSHNWEDFELLHRAW